MKYKIVTRGLTFQFASFFHLVAKHFFL